MTSTPRISLIGYWQNSYGSQMQIESQDANGQFKGIYSSTTGASGQYMVIGNAPTTFASNQPIALSIYWRSLSGGDSNPTWNWASVMNGLIQTDDKGTITNLQFLHGMVASGAYSAVDVYGPGVYTQTLNFAPVDPPAPSTLEKSRPATAQINATIDGTWYNQSQFAEFPTLSIKTDSNSPALTAQLTTSYGVISLSGLYNNTPINDSTKIAVSFSGIYYDAMGMVKTITLGGNFDSVTGLMDTVCFVATGVSNKATYSCVNVKGSEVFSRIVPS